MAAASLEYHFHPQKQEDWGTVGCEGGWEIKYLAKEVGVARMGSVQL
jgi:hypothetical protein